MESEVAEYTLHGKQANQQANTSPNHRPPSAKKAKDELANERTREQRAHA